MTENKNAAEKFKGRTKFKTLEQVSSLPEYAGILASDAILIDVDDMKHLTAQLLNLISKLFI